MSQILSVSQLNSYIMGIISNDNLLSDIIVSGEISNFKHHSSGHLYFTLKDERSLIKCVMFSSNAIKLNFRPSDGNKVLVKGYISVYEKNGAYQIYVQNISLEGTGDLFTKFENMKKKLQDLGYFDKEHKKEIPYLPSTIGVITSDTGAVINDILNVLKRRFSTYNILLYPTKVQGNTAYKEIIKGIEYFNKNKNVDVIILARGGGSIEDLWPFNEYKLALTIFNSDIPIISAIGHETDYTISDFVSDMRAPTPSAAAEIVLPNKEDIINFIYDNTMRINKAYKNYLENKKQLVSDYSNRPVLKRPEEFINVLQMNIDFITEKLNSIGGKVINGVEKDFFSLTSKIEALSPISIINRGFAIVMSDKGDIITSINKIEKNEIINIKISDGNIISKVIKKEVSNG